MDRATSVPATTVCPDMGHIIETAASEMDKTLEPNGK